MLPQNSFFIGVDLGQSRDFTAIAVVERAEVFGPFDHVVYAHRKLVSLCLRFLERVPLGTPYPEVVRRVVEVATSRGLVGHCRLAVDGTGVGRPVVDLLRAARPGCTVSPVIVTGGDSETESDGYHRVQNGHLKIAAGMAYGEDLVTEMAEMQLKVTAAGREQFGAWREGAHDDLVFAVALACWLAQKTHPKAPAGADAWCTVI